MFNKQFLYDVFSHIHSDIKDQMDDDDFFQHMKGSRRPDPDLQPDTLVDKNPKLWDDIRIHVESRCEPIKILKFIQKPDKLIVFFWVQSSCMFAKTFLSYKLSNDWVNKVEDEFGETLEFINILGHG